MVNKILWEKYHPNLATINEADDEDGDIKTVVHTAFGVFKLDNSLSPFTRFKFWLGNTNFNITHKIKTTLNTMDGVDALVILSRYQFIIGVGKMFDENMVKKNIENVLCEKLTLISALNKTYKYWVLYTFPNDNVTYYGDNNLNAIKKYVELYTEAAKISAGKIQKSKSLKELSV